MDTDRIIKRGYNPYLVLGGEDAGTGMDVGLLVMEPGDVFPISEKEKEVCALLLEGDVEFCWQGTVKKAGAPIASASTRGRCTCPEACGARSGR